MSVQIRNLCKTFGSKKVLNNFNITLENGGIYCLMGLPEWERPHSFGSS